MRICGSFEDCRDITDPLVLAAGVFDGVHLGHQAVMASAIEEARRLGAKPGVLTFAPHPACVLAPDHCPASLTTPSQKRELIAEQGIEVMIELPFTRDFATLGAMDFVQTLILSLNGGLRGICAGASWSFGKSRSGNMEILKIMSQDLGFLAREVPARFFGGEIISSTRIRKAVAAGRLDEARDCLGRFYRIRGTVQPGEQLGRELGFPTANVSLQDQELPPQGVYAGSVHFQGKSHRAAINLGRRPTVSKTSNHKTLEAHILDFEGNIYGEEIDVAFENFLRPERKFGGAGDLRTQIAADVQRVRESG
jgi:riboflavin kinase/FMN adenylyltransferase